MDDSIKGHRTFVDFLEEVGIKVYSVYIMKRADEKVLYVGFTWSLHQRMKEHYVAKDWIDEVAKVETIDGLTAQEAQETERELIRELRPVHNTTGGAESDGETHLEETLEADEEFRRVWDANRARRELGMLILEKRLELGISQRDLADRVGTSQNRIYLIENGEANPTLDTIQRLADVLGVSLEIRPRDLVAS